MSSTDSSFKTRVSAHLSDAFPAEEEVITVEGWLTVYDEKEKSWKPLDGKVKIFLDGREIGEAKAKLGMFSFSFIASYIGKHKLEVVFREKGYESSYKSLDFEVIKAEKKLRIERFAKIVFILLIIFVLLMFLLIFLLKL